MGMCRVNGPEALPLKPAGWDSLGKATRNICEAGSMYTPGFVPEPEEPEARMGRVIGQNVTLDLETLYFVRHAESGIAANPEHHFDALLKYNYLRRYVHV